MKYTVWGSPGSGKSMFACLLARSLGEDGKKSIIINADTDCPMLPVWLPGRPLKPGVTLGALLAAKEIDKAQVAAHVVIHTHYPSIGFLGYSAEDSDTARPPCTTTAIASVINAAAELVDCIILDCTAGARDKFTAVALLAADTEIQLLTPDHKGISFLHAQRKTLSNMGLKREGVTVYAGMARPFHDFDAGADEFGGYSGLLPYGKGMENEAAYHGMCAAFEHRNSRYAEALDDIVNGFAQAK